MDELVALLLRHGPLVVFAVTLAARAGAPLPAALLLVTAGGLSAAGRISPTVTVAVSILANLIGDIGWFVAGRTWGYRVLGLVCRVSLSPDSCVRQNEELFERWGGFGLLAAKFVPGVSLLAAPMAGALRMTWPRFLSWNLLGAFAWTAVFMGLGALFKSEINAALSMLADAGFKALLALGALMMVIVGSRWIARRREASNRADMLVSARDLADEIAQGRKPVLLDVRGRAARTATGSLEGSVVAELGRIKDAVADVPKDANLVTYCNCPNEASAVVAAHALRSLGFRQVRVLAGGRDGWADGAN